VNDGLMIRLGRCLRFEIAKLPGRKLPFIAVLAGALAALLSGYLEGRPPEDFSGWIGFARNTGRGLPVSAFFLAILGAVSINEELQSGALRATLLRPLDRFELIAAKAIVLLALSLVAGGLTLVAAATPIWTTGGFGDVMLVIEGLDPVRQFESEVIAAHGQKLAFISLLALPGAALLGLLVSTLVEGEGTAVAVTASLTGMLHFLGSAWDEAETLSFLAVPNWAMLRLEELGLGVTTHLDQIESLGLIARESLVSLFAALAFGLTALAVFRYRRYRL
jgi:ABC-2 family transporter